MTMVDIETNASAASNGKGKPGILGNVSFPVPKQLVTIYTPFTHTFIQQIANDATNQYIPTRQTKFAKGAWKDFVSSVTTVKPVDEDVKSDKPKKRRIKVKMGSMVVKMINKLVAENVIAHDRVFLTRNATHMLARILVDERTVPILLMRCERIGVGVVVGVAFGTSLEWGMAPVVTLEMQQNAKPFSLDNLRYGHLEVQLDGGTNKEHVDEIKPTPSQDADEEISLSSEDDVEEDEEVVKALKIRGVESTNGSVTSNGSSKESSELKILSAERKKQLSQFIADARREWLDTGSRLRVMQVLESVEAGAALTFDYISYVLLAAWVAGMGLITSSVAVVVASMLLSPLMGPCLGATLGATLRNGHLVRLGLFNECLSLVLCVVMGMLIGAIAVPAQIPAVSNWPSAEMTGRGTVNGLVMGIFIAIPSGMGVALSVLGRNSGGLTGVAISLSLLPPAVNAGICWMTAIFYKTGIADPADGDETDYAFVGSMSFCLTLINICCIFVGGCTMFHLKEVTPIKEKNTFWSRDVKIERGHHGSTLNAATHTIKMGVKAALELKEALAREGKLHEEGEGLEKMQYDQYDDNMKLADAKRRGLAANVLEDAIFVGGGGFNNKTFLNEVIPGGAISPDQIPDEVTFREEASLDSEKDSLLEAAAKVGGLETAGELLFAPFADELVKGNNIHTSKMDDQLGDYSINHVDVAGAVMLF